MSGHWEHYEHQADIGIRGFGGTMAEAFEQAALAMMAVMVEPGRVKPSEWVDIRCMDADPEILLADWLNAVLFEVSVRKMFFSCFQVMIGEGKLCGRACGERIHPRRHQPVVEVKGASYLGLAVRPQEGGGWLAQCVVDV